MKFSFKSVVIAAVLILAAGCARKASFIRVEDGHFLRDGKPYTFVGTNFWYGPILASEGRGGNYDRLVKELDALKELGLENLRVLVGGDGPDGVFSRVDPALQTWEWSGGYGQYLEWATGEKALIPLVDGYWPFMQQMKKFQTCEPAQELFYNHVRAIVGRTNSITGKPYKDDPAIFSWQIGNEPRCFSDDPEIRDGFIGWMTETARIIKEIDPNHLLSTGNEGLLGCENDIALVERVNSIPGIDYMTIHIWPYNWGWAKAESLEQDLDGAIAKTDDYIGQHVELADRLSLPIVVEEFGFPRDGFSDSREATTTCRDKYYGHIFGLVGGVLDGLNFWGWSGYANPTGSQWKPYDDYTGDPAQEAQGLNGVYITDSTIDIIKQSSNINKH